jgi:hypothetical protein
MTTGSPTPVDEASGPPVLDCYRDVLDGGAEHYVAQLSGTERIVATLRIEPARGVPLSALRRAGVPAVPDDAGAVVRLAADVGDEGTAGLARVSGEALLARRLEADDGFWLTACPESLAPIAEALGWRFLSPAASGRPVSGATRPMVLLLDDVARFEQLGSPLAAAAREGVPSAARLELLLDALGLDEAATATALPALRSAG